MKTSLSVNFGLMLLATQLIGAEARAADWNFSVGVSYLSGLGDVVDILEDNLEARGFTVDTLVIPIGTSIQGYAQFNDRVGAGFSVGPAVASIGDVDYIDIPLGVDARYFLSSGEKSRSYVRGGVRYHIADGDDIKSSDIGPFAGIGIEFRKEGQPGWGIEASYDGAEIEMINLRSASGFETVKPAAAMLTVFFVF